MAGKKVTLALTRDGRNLGVAKIGPGRTVKAKIAWSTRQSSTIIAAFNVDMFWSGEYSGKGTGLLADRALKTSSSSGASALLTTLGASIIGAITALAF